jgi:hypothetical protein
VCAVQAMLSAPLDLQHVVRLAGLAVLERDPDPGLELVRIALSEPERDRWPARPMLVDSSLCSRDSPRDRNPYPRADSGGVMRSGRDRH